MQQKSHQSSNDEQNQNDASLQKSINNTEAADYSNHQKNHCNCIVCGSNNPISLGLKFDVAKDGSVYSRFKGSSLFQGYLGILHGGIIATLLDATMTHCLFHSGISAVTGDLHVRYLKPTPYNKELIIKSWITSSYSVLYKVQSELTCDKVLLAKGEGKFMKT